MTYPSPPESGQWDPSFTPSSGYPAPRPRELPLSKAAVTSLIFGIIGGSILAIVFAIVGLAATGRNATRRGRGLAWAGLVLGIIWLVAIASLVVWAVQRQPDRDATGQVKGAGTSAVFDLRDGDCLRDPAATGEVTEAAVVPCTDSHLGQVAATVTLADGAFDLTRLQADAEKQCQTAVPPVLTTDAPKDLQLFTLVPDERAWNAAGKRTASCVVASTTPLTSSVVAG